MNAAALRALNSHRYACFLFHKYQSPLLFRWDAVFSYIDDVYANATPGLTKSKIMDLNTPYRRALLIKQRDDRDALFVREALKQILSEL
tara:strand:- start:998 stop:1264 length:267 start_codon:yes stop_codon:yes gene_type:complete